MADLPTKIWLVRGYGSTRIYQRKSDASLKLKYNPNSKVYQLDLEVGPDWKDVTQELKS